MSLAWTALSDEVWVDALTLSGHGLGLSAERRSCRGRSLPFRPFPTKFRSMTQSGSVSLRAFSTFKEEETACRWPAARQPPAKPSPRHISSACRPPLRLGLRLGLGLLHALASPRHTWPCLALTSLAAAWTASCSKCYQLSIRTLRLVACSARHDSAELSVNGLLSLQQVKTRDSVLAEHVEQGLSWWVVSKEVAEAFPTMLQLIQASQNATLQKAESEVQLLRRIFSLASSQDCPDFQATRKSP